MFHTPTSGEELLREKRETLVDSEESILMHFGVLCDTKSCILLLLFLSLSSLFCHRLQC